MTKNNKYWKGEEDLERDPSFIQTAKNEFSEGLPLEEVLAEEDFELSANRRDFLKMFGYSVSAVALAACSRAPVRKAIPYLVKPDEVTPGVPNYYSSTCGYTGMPIEVKVREGRPIKVDGNARCATFGGATSVASQAGLFDLYDNDRLKNPLVKGKESTWAAVDKDITTILGNINARNGKIVIVSSSINSPSTLAAIQDFKTTYPNASHLNFDGISYHGLLEGNNLSFGKSLIPTYHFEKADVIVSFEADFIGNWLMADKFTGDYSSRRDPSKGMSKHIQFESDLSLTGSNADVRYPIQSSNVGLLLISLYNAIANQSGSAQLPIVSQADVAGEGISKTAKDLLSAKGKSIVVCGSNNPKHQVIVNAINMALGNYSNTININNPINLFKGNDTAFNQFVDELKNGAIDGVIFYGANPVYNHPKGAVIKEALKSKVKLSISSSSSLDETSAICQYVTPDNHYLEAWNDYQPVGNTFTLGQPTISPVFKTRQMQESLLSWAGVLNTYAENTMAERGTLGETPNTTPFYNYIKSKWSVSDSEFNQYLHDGFVIKELPAASAPSMIANATAIATAIEAEKAKNTGVELKLIEKTGIKAGELSNNPLVQELPDPISKVTWHNYVAVSKITAVKEEIKDNDIVDIKVGNRTISLPAIVQPGQANGTASIHLGYGRTVSGKVAKNRGVNLFPWIMDGDFNSNVLTNVSIKKSASGDTYELARTQTHHHIEGRDIVRETTLAEFKKDSKAGNRYNKPELVSLWYEHDYRKEGAPNHLWGMAIDMNKCTGCAACIVSCSIENNVPVVGEIEVRRRREMHWLRIDRYFTFNNVDNINYKDKLGKVASLVPANFEPEKLTREKALEAIDDKLAEDVNAKYSHYENVSVVHQAMMCQHCGSAPCETVCPVLATTHSSEGLNQMTYNRCIGTKYCGNNCPYKVRRFNWFRYNDNNQFDFHFNNDLGKMVLNPDVTVRTRGVMEKCSFCVQRIQAAKLTAKRENRYLEDGDIKTACQRACPANAIVFGDLHDKESEVTKLFHDDRGFSVLEELNVKPSVRYMTKVRNV